MGRFFAAAGRFKMEWLISVVFQPGKKLSSDAQIGGDWGMAYAHGNRLEILHVRSGKTEPGILKTLTEIKTDMALIYQDLSLDAPRQNRLPPYSRYEAGTSWTFCYTGKITRPELLFPNWQRTPGGLSIGELLFAYVYDRFDPNQPVESLNTVLTQLRQESELSFCLMAPEFLAIACRTDGRTDNQSRLWLGRGELLRIICSGNVQDLPDIHWEPVPAEQLIFIRRQRWAVV